MHAIHHIHQDIEIHALISTHSIVIVKDREGERETVLLLVFVHWT